MFQDAYVLFTLMPQPHPSVHFVIMEKNVTIGVDEFLSYDCNVLCTCIEDLWQPGDCVNPIRAELVKSGDSVFEQLSRR